jgi:hypothetical protein
MGFMNEDHLNRLLGEVAVMLLTGNPLRIDERLPDSAYLIIAGMIMRGLAHSDCELVSDVVGHVYAFMVESLPPEWQFRIHDVLSEEFGNHPVVSKFVATDPFGEFAYGFAPTP